MMDVSALVFLVLCVIFLSTVLVDASKEPSCPSSGTYYYPHDKYCDKYYSCKNGKLKTEKCPKGLHFNAEISACDWPANCHCQIGQPSTTTTTTTPKPTTTPRPVHTSCPAVDPMDYTVLLPHPSDCNKYIRCFKGEPETMRCPAGLHFNAKLSYCDWPSNAKCKSDSSEESSEEVSTTTTTTTTTPTPTTTLTTTPTTTPTTNTPTPTYTPTTTPSTNYTTPPPCQSECPMWTPPCMVIRLPNENDCNSYYGCFDGYKVPLNCRFGWHFSPVMRICLPKRYACCESQPSTTWHPPTSTDPTVTTTENITITETPSTNATTEWTTWTTAETTDTTPYPTTEEPTDTPSTTEVATTDTPSTTQSTTTDTPSTTQSTTTDTVPTTQSTTTDTPSSTTPTTTTSAPETTTKFIRCEPLPSENCQWFPPTCSSEYGNVGDNCNIVCDKGYEIFGGQSVYCTPDGWLGYNGIEVLPECRLTSEVAEEIVDSLNNTMGDGAANILFVLDESGSVAPWEFVLEIKFIKGLIGAFPLSVDHRCSGTITFATFSDVDIPLNTVDTCSFMEQADGIVYHEGGTDTLTALQTAINETDRHAIHNQTIVFLLTDGESFTDPTPAADYMKSRGDILYMIGIADYLPKQLIPLASLDSNGEPLFFGIDSFKIFEQMAEYLDNKYDVECAYETTTTSASTPPV